MNGCIGFDHERYLQEQSAAIIERIHRFNNKLYLEFGGKLAYDHHAARVLPGFDPNAKIKLLQNLKDKTEIILCVYAGDIERRKIRADSGLTYDADALKLMDDLREWQLDLRAVVITRCTDNQHAAQMFRDKLERRGIKVYAHHPTRGYPSSVDTIVSDEGYGANEPVHTAKPLVAVIGPGPCSGKLSTCLHQLYHDYRNGINSGYAKFETFPVWNLPIKHPVNLAYEAATADIRDFNMIDPFHIEAYNETAVNYNRDIEAFPLLRKILSRILGQDVYRSPTDMGVNRAGFAITDDDVVRQAAHQEIIRRYFKYSCDYAMGLTDQDTVEKTACLLEETAFKPEDRRVVLPARRAAQEAREKGKGHLGVFCGAAIELRDGAIITGKNSPLLHAASSVIINTVKHLAQIPDKMFLLPPAITQSVAALKQNLLKQKNASMDVEEMLIALSISATSNPAAQLAMENLQHLAGCEIHLSHMPTSGDQAGLRRLGLNVTADPRFASQAMFED